MTQKGSGTRWELGPLLLVLACSQPIAVPVVPPGPPSPPLDMPEPWELSPGPAPDPFVSFATGEPIGWEERRGELLTLFAHYVYGQDVAADEGKAFVDSGAFEHGQLHNVAVTWERPAFAMNVTVFTPPGDGPFPVFVALNKCGNQSLGPWEEVPVTGAFVPSSCPGGAEERGSRADSWPVEAILDAGWALAAVHQNELVPDDRELAFDEGLLTQGTPGADPRSNWGAIGAWAWGLSRALDTLALVPTIDVDRAVPVGHSRRGKSALLAAARDERFAGAIAHQSGTGGVTLSRSDGGESVGAITEVFPHWFAPRFADFAGLEDHLPVDQHLLVALVAPRPFLATDGDEDDWADPTGAVSSVRLAAPVWEHYGAGGLVLDGDGAPTLDGDLAWGARPGGHSLEAQDWERFLTWVETVGL